MENGSRPKILYVDSDLIVCVKPAGVISEEKTGGKEAAMPDLLREYFALNNDKTEVYCVHRLDAGTRGVMVYARNKKAAAALSESIRQGLFTKEYEALVHGNPDCEEGGTELADYLLKDNAKNKVYVVKSLRKGVKEARLVYTVKETRGDTTLVRIKLITGRTHQIRVQFASRGWPVLGDRRYGAKDDLKTLHLCAVAAEFPHPATGKNVRFEIESEL